MEKLYEILRLKSDTRPVVVATSYINVLCKIHSIHREIAETGYEGEVLFEQLLSNGHARNRFLRATTGNLFSDLEITEAPNQSVLDELDEFYVANPDYVQMSSLTQSQKDAITERYNAAQAKQLDSLIHTLKERTDSDGEK